MSRSKSIMHRRRAPAGSASPMRCLGLFPAWKWVDFVRTCAAPGRGYRIPRKGGTRTARLA